MISRSAAYAIRAMSFLAARPPGKLAGAKEIATAEHIPIPFLWKILGILAQRRLIRSFKGLHGGYELARPAAQITLQDIAGAADNTDSGQTISECVLGLAQCSDQNACPLHGRWKEIRAQLDAMLRQQTLADLARVAPRRAARG
jgi:Rrf2 family protein